MYGFSTAGLDDFLKRAIDEDIGTGDITTNATIPQNKRVFGRYIAKDTGVICGMDIVARVFDIVGGDVVLEVFMHDGDEVKKGDVIAEVRGNAHSVLTGERVGLNLLQHLSGIATRTRLAVDAVSGTSARIADTRKATPGLRAMEKYAVRVGGGSNHRFNLADGVLIKDNHIVAAGGITAAVTAARENAPHTLKIEVETETIDQVNEALSAGADIIMLDNMSVEMMAQAVKVIDGRAVVEASGNMGDRDAASLRTVADTGVDIISIGALTNYVKPLDISLKFSFID